MKFLSNVIATIIGVFLFFIICFFGIIFLSAIFGGNQDEVNVKKQSVIELKLDNVSLDYTGKFSDPLIVMLSKDKNVGFTEVLHAIEAAKNDDKIEGISLLNTQNSLGLAQLKALRDQLEDFKASGKFVVSYADYFTQKEYYLNSVADTLYLNPVGMMDFKGLSSEVLFFKDFQEKSGIKMEVIRHGKYKSAVEPFIANEMSDENREQISALLMSAWNNIIEDIAISRGLSTDELNTIADNLAARTPEMALDTKLIDKIAYEDAYHNGIKKAVGVSGDKDYNTVSITDYAKKVKTTPIKGNPKDKIAVIYAQGEIKGGEGEVNVIGEGAMRRSLQKARKDKNVKAIVLRIDSPGGSALTSELIWREVELTKKTKPVVVSMGNLAASGGYYIACNANKIIAEPNTITGSIGVFGAVPNMTQLSKNIGINSSIVRTHKNAAEYSLFQPMDETTKAMILENVETIYATFLQRVASGRNLTIEEVDAVAQGRVWTGSDALNLGLVDQLGGLDTAIEEAAKMVKIEKYRTQSYPEFDMSFGDLLNKMPFAQTKEKFIQEEIGTEAYETLQMIKRLTAKKGIQAAMPFELKIK